MPNNSYLRPVINGIGVFSLAKKSDLSGLILNFDDDNIFINNSTGYTLKGYDKFFNPVEISSNAKISFNNSNAKYENGEIIGQKEGLVTVTASIDNISISKELRILGDIYSLEISPKSANITPNKSQEFVLMAKDKNGYTASIDNSIVNWVLDGNGKLINGIYTANDSGTAIISASIGSVKAYSKVCIDALQTALYDDFEKIDGSFSSYPSTLNGSISLSNKCKTGNNSIKLQYNFNTNDAVKGAYYDYTNKLSLPNSIKEIGLWIYNPTKNSNSLKSQYTNTSGLTAVAVLSETLNWTGWKYITYPSPDKIKSIVSIYVAQSETSSNTSNSYINIDSLTVTYYGHTDDNLVIPDNIYKQDIYNYTNSSSKFNIAIIEEIQTPKTLFDTIKNNKLISELNNNSNLVVFNKKTTDSDLLSKLNCEYISNNGYSKYDKDNCSVITIDVSKSGIRQTDYSQFEKLLDDIENTKKNTFIVLNNSLDSFSDELEKQLLLDILVEQKNMNNKNCWIIQKGNTTKNENYNGIKILTIGNDAISRKDINGNIDNYCYIKIYVDSNNISYDIKNVF